MTGRTILVTGGLGFIGSNFIKYWNGKYPGDEIVNIDKRGHGSVERDDLDIYYDITLDLLQGPYFPFPGPVDGIFHFASESHVDRSITDGLEFAKSNVVGTVNLLEWMKGFSPEARLVLVSTDEVFGDLGPNDPPFTEESPQRPSSPYSASKALQEHFCRAYARTYGLDVVIGNSVNNFGPWQHDEKFIPTVIRAAMAGKGIPIYGDGRQRREWLHVDDHCAALDFLFHKGISGESYCIGSGWEISNLNMADIICNAREIPDLVDVNVNHVADRLGHDRRYAVNSWKLHNLGWKPKKSDGSHIGAVVKWYADKYSAQGSK